MLYQEETQFMTDRALRFIDVVERRKGQNKIWYICGSYYVPNKSGNYFILS